VRAATFVQLRSPSVCPPRFERRPSRPAPPLSVWEAGDLLLRSFFRAQNVAFEGCLVKELRFIAAEQPLCCFRPATGDSDHRLSFWF
jgi:hypothetical protein